MGNFIPKWHKELDIFSKIKPIIILEGNVLDRYQYPVDGSVDKGSILRLVEYLHYYFKDQGYQNIVFYDSIRGFYNNCEDGYTEQFARLVGGKVDAGTIKVEFKGKSNTTATYIRTALTQAEESSVVVLDFASRYITDPNNMEQAEIDGFTILLQSSLEGKDVELREEF